MSQTFKILRPSLLKGQIHVEDRYIPYHPCMVYLPTCRLLTFMVNVGKYTIHGYYGHIPIVDYGSFFPIAMNYISGFTELFEKSTGFLPVNMRLKNEFRIDYLYFLLMVAALINLIRKKSHPTK